MSVNMVLSAEFFVGLSSNFVYQYPLRVISEKKTTAKRVILLIRCCLEWVITEIVVIVSSIVTIVSKQIGIFWKRSRIYFPSQKQNIPTDLTTLRHLNFYSCFWTAIGHKENWTELDSTSFCKICHSIEKLRVFDTKKRLLFPLHMRLHTVQKRKGLMKMLCIFTTNRIANVSKWMIWSCWQLTAQWHRFYLSCERLDVRPLGQQLITFNW